MFIILDFAIQSHKLLLQVVMVRFSSMSIKTVASGSCQDYVEFFDGGTKVRMEKGLFPWQKH